jgi:dihydrofolate synthase/folylpolyglutamate synthase
MHDKDAAAMLAPLARVTGPVVLTRAPGPRAAEPSALRVAAREHFPDASLVVEPDIERALALAWTSGSTIVVAGSLYLAGDVLARLGQQVP